jgi:hypothetical protein
VFAAAASGSLLESLPGPHVIGKSRQKDFVNGHVLRLRDPGSFLVEIIWNVDIHNHVKPPRQLQEPIRR